MTYHIEFDIAAVFITLFILYYIIFKKGLRRHANRIYLVMLFLTFIAEVSDIVGSIINNDPSSYSVFMQYTWNYIYLGSHNIIAYYLVIYIFYIIGYEKTKRLNMTVLFIPMGVELILLGTNPIHHMIFYLGEGRQYLHGVLFPLIYVVALAYMTFAIYLCIRHRKGLTPASSNALLFFITITFIPVLVQIIFPMYLLTLFFETLGLMGILFTIENKDDVLNPTTGLLNRYSLQTALDRVMLNGGSSLVLIKVPNLNYYNKMIGFGNMNAILGRISNWLNETYPNYACYDCGRGHFAVLLEGAQEEEIETLKKKTVDRFEKPWAKGKISIVFPVQFGLIKLPDDVRTMENLFMLIDAPYDGKSTSFMDVKNDVAAYERNVLIERLIDKALKNRSFQVYYQPIWGYGDGKVRSAEALCRLIDDEHGVIPPDEFIPIAERNGTILEIGKFVFEEACRFYKEARLDSLGIDYIEVNLSVVQCVSRDLMKTVDDALAKYSLDARHINLEITESATAQEHKVLLDTIDTLKQRGFVFSLDDYGTGYSNITYMYEMPFSIIKIDKSILWKAMHPKNGEGQRNAVIYLENTIRMLKDMDYSVLVEGVETLEQKLLLEKLGCDYMQGFYFSKPVQGAVFTDYVRVVNA